MLCVAIGTKRMVAQPREKVATLSTKVATLFGTKIMLWGGPFQFSSATIATCHFCLSRVPALAVCLFPAPEPCEATAGSVEQLDGVPAYLAFSVVVIAPTITALLCADSTKHKHIGCP